MNKAFITPDQFVKDIISIKDFIWFDGKKVQFLSDRSIKTSFDASGNWRVASNIKIEATINKVKYLI
jgi:hypothetical protein